MPKTETTKTISYTPDFSFEIAAKGIVCGVDEAGRGPLAGPVVAAAVILDPRAIPVGLNDSKTLSKKRRELLLNDIRSSAKIGIGISEPEEIDKFNILWATLRAMQRAVVALGAVDHALIDGNRVPPNLKCKATAIIKGDARSLSISAASIVAKVMRDNLMEQADLLYSGYGLAQHKGYPTKAHMAALEKLGPTPIHRFSFAPVQKAIRLI